MPRSANFSIAYPGVFEEFNILRIFEGGPAAFNEGQTQFIELLCDANFIVG